MDAKHLLARREAVISRHKTLESVAGSGWHPDDHQAQTEARAGKPPLSQRIVALHHDGTYWVCGPCVPVMRKALAKYAKEATAEIERIAAEHAALGLPPSEEVAQAKQARLVAARVGAATGDVIELTGSDWNSCMYAMGELKIPVVTSGVVA